MESILFAYPWDLLDAGLDRALSEIRELGQQRGISVAVSYHHGRFLRPHIRPAVRFAEGSRVYFKPDLSRYGEIKPMVATLAQDRDPLAEILPVADRAGLAVHAWTVCLHNTSLGTLRPDLAVQNALGDPLSHGLCPSNPAVREYLLALTGDLAGRGLREIELEAVRFMGFPHGHHHEKTGVPLDPWHEFLMALCFCPACRERAARDGIDAERVRRMAASELEAHFDQDLPPGDAPAADIALTRALVDGDFVGYLRSRIETVTSLVAGIREAVRPVQLSAYVGGVPGGGWAEGLVVERLLAGGLLDTLLVGMYGLGPQQAGSAFRAAERAAAGRAGVGGMLSGIAPNVASSHEIVPTVRALMDLGVPRINLYNYGLMRRPTLAAIGEALA